MVGVLWDGYVAFWSNSDLGEAGFGAGGTLKPMPIGNR